MRVVHKHDDFVRPGSRNLQEPPVSFLIGMTCPAPFRRAGRCALARLAVPFLSLAAVIATASAGAQVCATPGRDGPGGVLSGVVNTYYPANASVTAGSSTTISLLAATAGSVPIAAGDLLLVIQMQDATIDVRNSARYGGNNGTGSGATNWGTAGQYEFIVATSAVGIGGGTLSFRGAGAANRLVYSYTNVVPVSGVTAQKRFQVVRVPQYSSATLGGGIVTPAWNGRAGGVLVLDIAGTATVSGVVSADGKGFRGGAGRGATGGNNGGPNDYRVGANVGYHGQKGEGVAGTPQYVWDGAAMTNTGVDGYRNGSSARGAPANAGGGGTDGNPGNNDENSGGGGGGNAGAGGRGGNSWNSNLNVGGRGGALSASAQGRLILGGGGGAATTNNATGFPGAGLASSGAPGGGIIMLRAGRIAGSGTLSANGMDANNTVTNDGSGGGGAGGSILVYATTNSGMSALTLSARGGNGGSNSGGGVPHGPGGGGGGGFIATNGGGPATILFGGANGTTSNGAFNATGGASGTYIASVNGGTLPGISPSSLCIPQLTVTKTTSTASVTAGGTATYTVTVTNAAGRDTARSIVLSDTLPAGMTFASGTPPTLLGGATFDGTVLPAVGDAIVRGGVFAIPGGAQVTATFTVNVAGRAAPGVRQNGAVATYLDPERTIVAGTTTAIYNSASSPGEDVNVAGAPDLRISKSHSGSFIAGRPGVYAIVPSNAGFVATTGTVTVVDTLPAGLTFASFTGAGWACAAAAQIVTCTSGAAIAAGAAGSTISLTVTVAVGAAPGVTNIAAVAGGAEPAGNADDNRVTDPTAVLLAGVAVTPDGVVVPRLPSNAVSYTQTYAITNSGSAGDVLTLVVTGTPGTIVAIVSVNGVAGPTTTITVAAGATANVNVVYTVKDTAASLTDSLRLKATSGNDPLSFDNGEAVITVIRAQLSMTKEMYRDDRVTLIGPADQVQPGEFVQYKVTITSSGGADATTVIVTDALPGPVTYDSATGDAAGWTFTPAGANLTAQLAGTLPAGQSRFFWVRVRVQ